MNSAHVGEGPLRALDLNLLVAFDVLLATRSVTRAAERLGVTQSAMSHTLRRLRVLFDDPVLVRSGGKMLPTPRAEALAVPLRAGLLTLERALEAPAAFDPATTTRTFTFAGPDLVEMLHLPVLLRTIEASAPGVDLAVLPLGGNLEGSLASGSLDVALMPRLLDGEGFDLGATRASPDLRSRTLFRDGFRVFVRRGHPGLSDAGRIGLRAYREAGHLLVAPGGGGVGVVVRVLRERGLERRIRLRTPGFGSALALVAASDLVLTAPTSLAGVADARVVVAPPPVRLPEHAIDLLWHPRFGDDPAHRWFRERVAEAAKPYRPR